MHNEAFKGSASSASGLVHVALPAAAVDATNLAQANQEMSARIKVALAEMKELYEASERARIKERNENAALTNQELDATQGEAEAPTQEIAKRYHQR